MEPLPRLLDETSGASRALRGALHAARADGPDARRLAAIAAGLSLGAAALPIASAGADAGAAAGAGSGGVAAAGGLKVKALLLAAATAVGAAGGGIYWRRHQAPAPPAPPTAPAPAAGPTITPLPAPEAPAPEVPAPEAAAPAPLRAPPRPARRVAAPKPAAAPAEPPAPPAADIAAETRLLDQAKAALARDPAGSGRLAAEHERLFPQGLLAQEREVIAIEALVRAGALEAARARADGFVRRFPRSAHRRRVEALVGAGAAGDR
jgi:hypothetical protein